MSYKVLFSNIGYAKGIDGSLRQHISRAGRHLYCALPVQEQVLAQVRALINAENPDLCCFVEIDRGSFHSARFNQIEALMDTVYHFHDISDKYGEESPLKRMLFHTGKSNAFLAKAALPFQRLYFSHGTKRLIYRLEIPGGIHVFFAHFSLKEKTRLKQLEEMRRLVSEVTGEVIILADFNILRGFSELKTLLDENNLLVLNDEKEHTFTFHRRKLALDLCICSESLLDRINLKIIPQPFSDHAALLVDIRH